MGGNFRSGGDWPLFLDETMVQLKYEECIAWFIEQLNSKEKYRRSYIMQDEATPHTALTIRAMLHQYFPRRVIGKYFKLSWPPYSPDLTPADFLLWPILKRAIYAQKIHLATVISLKK